MRGRKPAGPKYVEQLPGSDQAKERAQVILETLAGTCRMDEACRRLQIGRTRFHEIRRELLQAALASQEPKPIGRPPRGEATLPAAEVAELHQRLAELEVEARTAQVQEEIAVLLPRVGATADTAEKKTRRRPRTRRRRSGRGT